MGEGALRCWWLARERRGDCAASDRRRDATRCDGKADKRAGRLCARTVVCARLASAGWNALAGRGPGGKSCHAERGWTAARSARGRRPTQGRRPVVTHRANGGLRASSVRRPLEAVDGAQQPPTATATRARPGLAHVPVLTVVCVCRSHASSPVGGRVGGRGRTRCRRCRCDFLSRSLAPEKPTKDAEQSTEQRQRRQRQQRTGEAGGRQGPR